MGRKKATKKKRKTKLEQGLLKALKEAVASSGYWICDFCADKEGFTTKYPTGGNTVSIIDCDFCKEKGIKCTPVVDFKQSGSKMWD